jgi:transcriptional regulator with XRE-family HTH domain
MISSRLKEERVRLGWNQERLAEVAGCTRRSVVDWENENSTALPKAEQLEKLAEHGVDVYYVLTGQRIGLATTLSVRESALVENYRAAPEEAKKALETTSAALAGMPAAGPSAQQKQTNISVGANHGQVVEGGLVNNGPVSFGGKSKNSAVARREDSD